MVVTGPNEKSIFLPTGGVGDENGISRRNDIGYYWGGELLECDTIFNNKKEGDSAWASALYMNTAGSEGEANSVGIKRFLGLSVRPVYKINYD